MGGGAFRNVVARAFSTCALSPPPLAGYRVLELQGLAAAPLAGQILADFGADVVRVDGDGKGGGVHLGASVLGRGKRSVALDLKSKEGQRKCRSLAENCDVVLEGFRPGVMERLGLGPGDLLERNPGLVFARVTGWGQDGPWASLAGHDINYCSITGALDICGDSSSTPAVRPMPPGNLMADHMGGTLTCVFGIVAALLERDGGAGKGSGRTGGSGKGQVIDCAMTDGLAQAATLPFKFMMAGAWSETSGENMLDGGAYYYGSYACKGGSGYIAVGPLEPKFFELFEATLSRCGALPKNASLPPQNDRKRWDEGHEMLRAAFLTRTRDEWAAEFDGSDACVSPVLSFTEAQGHEHMRSRGVFVSRQRTNERVGTAMGDGMDTLVSNLIPPRAVDNEIAPAPRLSRTPAVPAYHEYPQAGQHTEEVFREWGVDEQ